MEKTVTSARRRKPQVHDRLLCYGR